MPRKNIDFDQDIINRKQELDNNILFNNTTFIVDPDTFEIQSPSLKNLDISCSSNQEEFFRNCFKQLGQGATGVFYSSEINKQFGIRKLEINVESKDALENEISLLRFFRQNFDEFPFVAHMYGWMDNNDTLNNERYIILEHKDTDLKKVLQKLSKYNDDITDEFLNIYSIILVQLFFFAKYNIYHQDLHAANILIKKYDSPVHITWNGLDIHTKYVPFIHDFDYAGVRGKSKIKNINNNNTVKNKYWESIFSLRNVSHDVNYYKKAYDTYQLFHSMIHNTLVYVGNDGINSVYEISLDLTKLFNKMGHVITDNDFSSYILMSIFNSDKYKIINKSDNSIEYKMKLNVVSYFMNNKLIIKTPILHYTQLNPLFKDVSMLIDIYSI
jgi:hypothetical protein